MELRISENRNKAKVGTWNEKILKPKLRTEHTRELRSQLGLSLDYNNSIKREMV